jgi:ubiquinone/menaquinone biosynthesis C-methylase UbiE
MKISQATALIRTPLIEWSRPQSWCDLGCGSGTFTIALALLLASGSTIHAVDLDQGALEGIPDQYDGVAIRKILGDLRSPSVRLPSVDGILMPNSLRFIREQHLFLRRLLSVTDRFLIVEYERSRPSPWGTLSGRLRKALRTLQRGRSGACGETGNTAIAVWWHDVLGLCRTIQSVKP